MYVRTYVRTYVCMYVCVYIYIYIHVYIYIYTYICSIMQVCIIMYVIHASALCINRRCYRVIHVWYTQYGWHVTPGARYHTNGQRTDICTSHTRRTQYLVHVGELSLMRLPRYSLSGFGRSPELRKCSKRVQSLRSNSNAKGLLIEEQTIGIATTVTTHLRFTDITTLPSRHPLPSLPALRPCSRRRRSTASRPTSEPPK